jgi:phage-related minor tail protein
MAEEFSLSAKISGDSTELKESLESGKEALKEFGIDVQKIQEFLMGGAGLALAFAAVAEKGFEAAKEFDEVGASMGKMTGETGAALDSLKTSLTNVVSAGVVQNVDDIGKGMGELHIRLGLVGEDLEKSTTLFSAFADVTGQTVAGSVENVTKLMQQWNIPAAELSTTLDKLTLTSQLTGEQASMLTQTLTQAGPVFKSAGIDIDTATGMIIGFSKAGVNAGDATQAINAALRKFAQEGVKDSGAALTSLIKEIQTTDDKSRAATLAVENFGRTGVKMGDAIRSGALDVKQWTDQIANAEGTLEKTDKATESFDDTTAKLAGQLQGLLAESFKSVLQIAQPFLQMISQGIAAFESLPGPVKAVAEGLVILTGGMKVAQVAMAAFGLSADIAMGPIGLIVGAISLLAIGLSTIKTDSEESAQGIMHMRDTANGVIGPVDSLTQSNKLSEDQIEKLVKIYPELDGLMLANVTTMKQAKEMTDQITKSKIEENIAHEKAIQLAAQDKQSGDVDYLQKVYKVTSDQSIAIIKLKDEYDHLKATHQSTTEASKAYLDAVAKLSPLAQQNIGDVLSMGKEYNKLGSTIATSSEHIKILQKDLYDLSPAGQKAAESAAKLAADRQKADMNQKSSLAILTSAEKQAALDRQKAEDAANEQILADDLANGDKRIKLIEKITKEFIAGSDDRVKYFDIETARQIQEAQQVGLSQEMQDVLAENRLRERAKLVDEVVAKEKAAWDSAMSSISQTMSNALPQLGTVFTSLQKLSGDLFSGIKNGVGDVKKFVTDLAGEVASVVNSIFGAIDKATQASSQKEIAAIDKEIAARKKQLTADQAAIDKDTLAKQKAAGVALKTTLETDQEALNSALATGDAINIKAAQDQLTRDTLTQQGVDAKQKAADEEAKAEENLNKKKSELAFKAAHAQWEMQIIQAAAGAALAIIQCYSSLGPIAGTVAAVLVGATTGIEIGLLASNEPKMSAYAQGTSFSTGGAALLGEQGPELVMSPSVHNLAKGSTVLTAAQTAQAIGGKGSTINLNIGTATRDTVGAIAQAVNTQAKRLRFQGVLS